MPNHPTNPDLRITDGQFYADGPHEAFAWARDNAPVYWDEAGDIWGITLYEDVMGISKQPETFSNAGGIRPEVGPLPHMIDMDDPAHKRRRNLVNRGFTKGRVEEREPRVREICGDLIEKVAAQGEFDLVHDVAAWLPLIVIGDMLGVEPERYPDLLKWSDDLIVGSGSSDPAKTAVAAESFVAYNEHQAKVLADRRGRPPQSDLVSVLVHSEIDGDKLTDDELLAESLLILIGGDETTRHVLTGGAYELLRRPEMYAELGKHPEKIPLAVEEMLRWVTPIQNMARIAVRDVELRGETIREGQKLLLLYPSANRDERMFERPMEFDITRDPNDHVAFGYGSHFCLGASLARLELRIFFEELVKRLPELRLASNATPERRVSNFITGIEELPVRVSA
ncbi:MAG: cytochrome P450 [Candidatus Binatia bacterium]|nr:cytochrome P450 [Candidatus Binatia bacterium]